MSKKTPKQKIDWEREFDEKFPDPMTKKYGEGFALYCSFCHGEGKENIKSFIRQLLSQERREWEEGLLEKINRQFIEWESKIPYPDPITQQEKLEQIIKKGRRDN